MTERILQIITFTNLSPSQFADRIGVQRSSISHIISGRNRPSLEFVQKILSRFPEINPSWLLAGKGDMFGQDGDEKKNIKSIKREPDLFDEVVQAPVVSKSAKITKNQALQDGNDVKGTPHTINSPDGQEREKNSENHKSVAMIIIHYSDRTFRILQPE